jgi:unsaturated rhamnogalacturonyl hydrolase
MAYTCGEQHAQYTITFEDLDDVIKQFELIQKNARDSKTGLFYHGWDESKQMPWANKTTGTSLIFGRVLWLVCMALVDVLDYFPRPSQAKRIELLEPIEYFS